MQIQRFNQNSLDYDRCFAENEKVFFTELAAVRSLLPPGDGVEIGVGTGQFAANLGIQYGVEPASQMAARAVARGVQVLAGVAENLSIIDQSFDFALMVTVDCFLTDLPKALQEVRRILVPSGYLVVAFIDRETKLGQKYLERQSKSLFYRDACFVSAREMTDYLRNAGFNIEKSKQTIFSFSNEEQEIKDGYGEGVFVALKARKKTGVPPVVLIDILLPVEDTHGNTPCTLSTLRD